MTSGKCLECSTVILLVGQFALFLTAYLVLVLQAPTVRMMPKIHCIPENTLMLKFDHQASLTFQLHIPFPQPTALLYHTGHIRTNVKAREFCGHCKV